MSTRHQIDTSLRFDRLAEQPERKSIEIPEQHPVPKTSPLKQHVPRETYSASAALEEVVNLAIALGRPLLLQGDPGCGKTRLAHAVAYALGLPLEETTVKSTTRAQDLLYTYDAVRRLYDAQMAGLAAAPVASKSSATKAPARRTATAADPTRIEDYIRYGPFGRAIIRACHNRRSVVLIDEIDKADLDFPNDLLRELDRLEFQVAEAPDFRWMVDPDEPHLRPIVFITHNEEKPLPPAFLRRCLFHYVEFPEQDLDKILGQHLITDSALRERAVEVVRRLRSANLAKKPGLSELLDWAGYLQATKVKASELEGDAMPATQALIKQREDLKPAQDALKTLPPLAPATR